MRIWLSVLKKLGTPCLKCFRPSGMGFCQWPKRVQNAWESQTWLTNMLRTSKPLNGSWYPCLVSDCTYTSRWDHLFRQSGSRWDSSSLFSRYCVINRHSATLKPRSLAPLVCMSDFVGAATDDVIGRDFYGRGRISISPYIWHTHRSRKVR
jgi:hypothetical protein